MSVKIGVAPGAWAWQGGASSFFRFVEACEETEWDSLWLTDRLVSPRLSLEPITALQGDALRRIPPSHPGFEGPALVIGHREGTSFLPHAHSVDHNPELSSYW